ncbi:MAG: uncharacterized protein KVP18_002363 [Porospora cf. gigantea A]|uniref:uncharacterized protein n=1 Tax=Porospora cf. gigantea A TaxID=2853593 RepID=UPI0035593B14|nr:MAG: hypothetical protein KVP18_002363 [Porospora cf. gigantea A]
MTHNALERALGSEVQATKSVLLSGVASLELLEEVITSTFMPPKDIYASTLSSQNLVDTLESLQRSEWATNSGTTSVRLPATSEPVTRLLYFQSTSHVLGSFPVGVKQVLSRASMRAFDVHMETRISIKNGTPLSTFQRYGFQLGSEGLTVSLHLLTSQIGEAASHCPLFAKAGLNPKECGMFQGYYSRLLGPLCRGSLVSDSTAFFDALVQSVSTFTFAAEPKAFPKWDAAENVPWRELLQPMLSEDLELLELSEASTSSCSRIHDVPGRSSVQALQSQKVIAIAIESELKRWCCALPWAALISIALYMAHR